MGWIQKASGELQSQFDQREGLVRHSKGLIAAAAHLVEEASNGGNELYLGWHLFKFRESCHV